MTTYARITAEGAFDRLVELTAEQYAELQANGKAAMLRVWVIDAQPVPNATQILVRGPIVIGPAEAHQTWSLRDKTQAELNIDLNTAERSAILQMVTVLSADIVAYNANPDTSGTAGERLTKIENRLREIERQLVRGNRIDRFQLRELT